MHNAPSVAQSVSLHMLGVFKRSSSFVKKGPKTDLRIVYHGIKTTVSHLWNSVFIFCYTSGKLPLPRQMCHSCV